MGACEHLNATLTGKRIRVFDSEGRDSSILEVVHEATAAGFASGGRADQMSAAPLRRAKNESVRVVVQWLELFGITSSILALSGQSPSGPAGGASDGYGLGRGAVGPGCRCTTTVTAAGALRVIV